MLMENGRSTVNIIYCGECSKIMREHIPDNSIDLTVTSPPYDNLRDYKGYTFDFELIATDLWRVTKPGGVVVWVVGDATINGSETGTSFRQVLGFMELGFNLHDTMIYEVPGTGAKGSNYAYWQSSEFMFILSKGRLKTFNPIEDRKNITAGTKGTGRCTKKDGIQRNITSAITKRYGKRTNIWTYGSNGYKKQHPAPFPEALARDHIISWSNPNNIVLDPMCGSGTTLKMAIEQGRQYIGIDISQEYCDLSQRRVDRARIPLPGLFDV